MYSEHLERVIGKAFAQERGDRSADPYLHATDLIDFCPRRYLMSKYTGAGVHPRQYHPENIKYVFRMGHKIQDILTDLLSEVHMLVGTYECKACGTFQFRPYGTGLCLECGKPALLYRDTLLHLNYKGVDVVGKVDMFVYYDVKLAFTTDAKSEDKDAFTKRQGINRAHQLQVNVYNWMLEQGATLPASAKFPEHVPKFDTETGAVVYLSKGAHKPPYKVYQAEKDKMFREDLEKKLSKVAWHIKRKTLPKPLCDSKFNGMAKACHLREPCLGG